MPAGRSARRQAALAGALLVACAAAAAAAPGDMLRLPPPAFPEVHALKLAGRFDDAIERLERTLPQNDAQQPLEAIVLRAVLHKAAGHPTEAERLWRLVIDRRIWMRTFARRALVASLAARGVPADAEQFLDDLRDSGPLRHLDLTLRVADAYRDAGDRTAARRLYGRVIDLQPRGVHADAARLGIAAALEADGAFDAALAQLRDAKRMHRHPDTFERAMAAEQRIGRAAGRLPAPLGDTDYRAMVRRLQNAARYDAALALIAEWRSAHPPADGGMRVEHAVIETLYAQRANETAVSRIQDFLAQFPESALAPDVKLIEFRLAVRQGDTDRARRLGRDLWEGGVPGATGAQRWNAANLLAAHLVAVGDVTGGLALYRGLFRRAASDDDRRAILWRAGIAALRGGQHERALTNLRALIDRAPNGELLPAGLYWLARAEEQATPAVAARRFQTIARRFPYHYYGARARQALGRLNNPVTAAPAGAARVRFPDLRVSDASRTRPEYRAAMLLARAGLVDDAAGYLVRLLRTRRSDSGLALLTARAAAEAGDHARVSRLLVNHFGRFLLAPAEGLPEDFWQLAFPRPFWTDIGAAGRRHGVDPLLLAALMRQESRFDPAAKSPVGAIGLFQIMPYTAEALAESAGVRDAFADGFDEAALELPRVNTLLGARLTGSLLGQFGGSTAPVAASYNAGEDHAAVWWAAASNWPEDVFVDTIPYAETRRFVRAVLTNYWTYQQLYGDR